MIYKVKVAYGPRTFAHIKVVEPLPYTGKPPFVDQIQLNMTEADSLEAREPFMHAGVVVQWMLLLLLLFHASKNESSPPASSPPFLPRHRKTYAPVPPAPACVRSDPAPPPAPQTLIILIFACPCTMRTPLTCCVCGAYMGQDFTCCLCVCLQDLATASFGSANGIAPRSPKVRNIMRTHREAGGVCVCVLLTTTPCCAVPGPNRDETGEKRGGEERCMTL